MEVKFSEKQRGRREKLEALPESGISDRQNHRAD